MVRTNMSKIERKFLTLVLAFVVCTLIIGIYFFNLVTDGVIRNLGQKMAENQARYNASRLLQPIEREIALVDQMASSPTLIAWAQNPEDEELYRKARIELESFRKNFTSKSYFLALTKNRAYYYNNSSGDYTGSEFQYILREGRPADQWFFSLVDGSLDLHLNVNPDVELGVTKLWIDVLMRNGDGQVLAVLGTGILLDDVIKNILAPSQDGVTSMFVDQDGAIQLYQDSRVIDFGSIAKSQDQKRTLDLIVDLPKEGARLIALLQTVEASPKLQKNIMTEYVWVSGKRHLVAMAYLPSIGWFDVTFLDLSTVFPRDRFCLLSFIFLCFFVVVILIVHYLINREIVRPISILSSALQKFSKGEMQPDTLENRHSGELWEIFDQFKNMAALVTDNTARLEAMVEERTRKLEAMAKVDSLTGLLNRNAMTSILKKEADRCSRLHLSFGLIWIDIDNFKDVNDTYGHVCGDELLAELATQLKKDLRTYDYAARWGGDEFIVLLSPSDEEQISRVAKRLCMSIGENSLFERYSTTVSTGWALSSGDESFEDVLALADQVLYQTKRQAKNVI